MLLSEFKNKAQLLIDQLQEHINILPKKGDTSSTCQKVALQMTLSEVQSTLNGLKQGDLEEKHIIDEDGYTEYCEFCEMDSTFDSENPFGTCLCS
jgi:hypothetical protein